VQVARALNNHGSVLDDLGRSSDALAAYEQVIDSYGADPAPALHPVVARTREVLQDPELRAD
jgi:hypothetical protein